MRLGHLVFAVFLAALGLAIAREPFGRVALIVFAGGAGILACGTAAVMMLFQAVGAIGEARDAIEYARGIVATGVVLVVGPSLMLALLAFCIATVQRVA